VLLAGAAISHFDDSVTDTIADTVAQGSAAAASLVARLRGTRAPVYLAGGVAVIAVLALLSILAATGHFWIHSV
jgi:NaMN:DMB phosphoribosyltransferase